MDEVRTKVTELAIGTEVEPTPLSIPENADIQAFLNQAVKLANLTAWLRNAWISAFSGMESGVGSTSVPIASSVTLVLTSSITTPSSVVHIYRIIPAFCVKKIFF